MGLIGFVESRSASIAPMPRGLMFNRRLRGLRGDKVGFRVWGPRVYCGIFPNITPPKPIDLQSFLVLEAAVCPYGRQEDALTNIPMEPFRTPPKP